MGTWLKLKEEASSYPSNCVTDAQKREHVQQWFDNEGIVLTPSNIAKTTANEFGQTHGQCKVGQIW